MRPLLALNPDDSPEGKRRFRIKVLALAGFLGAVAFVANDVSEKEWSERHTWQTALEQYCLFKLMGLAGRWRLQCLLRDVEAGEIVQRKLLSQLLARHQRTEYGKEQGLLGVSTLEEFRAAHPVTKHAHYAKYVSKVCDGKADVLAPGLPRLLEMPSGTSGQPDFIPHTSDMSKNFFSRGVCVAFGVLARDFPDAVGQLQRSAKITFHSPRRHLPETTAELEIGSSSSSPDDWGFQKLLCAYASPMAVYQIEKEPDALYAHALFALKDRNLGMLEANVAPLICQLLDTAAGNRRSLVQDLRNGHIWDRQVFDSFIGRGDDLPNEATRRAIDEALGGPAARRAEEIDACLRRGATAKEIWPKLRLVMATDGGAFAPAAARLRELLGDGVELYSPFYAAAEGLFGINVMPDRPYGVSTYVLDPGSMVFELLPLEYRSVDDPPRDAPIPAWEAKADEAYEMIVTTRGGLCRSRLGDIVRVHGFLGQMPVVSVQEHAPHTLYGERSAEGALHKTPRASRRSTTS